MKRSFSWDSLYVKIKYCVKIVVSDDFRYVADFFSEIHGQTVKFNGLLHNSSRWNEIHSKLGLS